MGIITANLKLFEPFIVSLLPAWFHMQWLYFIAVPGYFIACYLIGWMDEKKGIWKHESTYGWEVSPESMELISSIRMIRKYVEDQEERETKVLQSK
jgi:hypothetical protein